MQVRAKELVGDDRILTAYDRRVVPPFIEHAHVDPEDVGEIDGAVHSALIWAYDH